MSSCTTLPLRVLFITATVLALAGCGRMFSSNCNKPAAYANAQSLPPLKVPAELDAPDRRNALKISQLNTPEAPRVKGDPCLDQPPKYSSTAVLVKPGTEAK